MDVDASGATPATTKGKEAVMWALAQEDGICHFLESAEYLRRRSEDENLYRRNGKQIKYQEAIRNVITLASMRKVEEMSLGEFVEKLRTVFINGLAFNGESSVIGVASRRFFNILQVELASLGIDPVELPVQVERSAFVHVKFGTRAKKIITPRLARRSWLVPRRRSAHFTTSRVAKAEARGPKQLPPVGIIQWSSSESKGNAKASRAKRSRHGNADEEKVCEGECTCTWAKLGVGVNPIAADSHLSPFAGRTGDDGADQEGDSKMQGDLESTPANRKKISPDNDPAYSDINAILRNMSAQKRDLTLQFVRKLSGMRIRGVRALSALLAKMSKQSK
mmetsp:Transcript_848/g.1700  ORF Transcript_848/g.1700 Transcript_848/m.1700 type:complete len:336 (+) Transcript_848:94-1101(+)